MKIRGKAARILGMALLSLGLLLGAAFSTAAVWGDLEASLFDPSIGSEAKLTTLRCPVIITPRESGTIVARFSNPSDREVLRTVRAHISYGFSTLMREETAQFVLKPGETRKLDWEVTASDAAWRHFILVRVNALRNAPLPSYSGACGVLVLNIPGLSGGLTLALIVTLSVLLIAAGAALWLLNRPAAAQVPDRTNAVLALIAVVLVAMFAGAMGWWALGGLMILFALVLTASVATWAITRAS